MVGRRCIAAAKKSGKRQFLQQEHMRSPWGSLLSLVTQIMQSHINSYVESSPSQQPPPGSMACERLSLRCA